MSKQTKKVDLLLHFELKNGSFWLSSINRQLLKVKVLLIITHKLKIRKLKQSPIDNRSNFLSC